MLSPSGETDHSDIALPKAAKSAELDPDDYEFVMHSYDADYLSYYFKRTGYSFGEYEVIHRAGYCHRQGKDPIPAVCVLVNKYGKDNYSLQIWEYWQNGTICFSYYTGSDSKLTPHGIIKSYNGYSAIRPADNLTYFKNGDSNQDLDDILAG